MDVVYERVRGRRQDARLAECKYEGQTRILMGTLHPAAVGVLVSIFVVHRTLFVLTAVRAGARQIGKHRRSAERRHDSDRRQHGNVDSKPRDRY
jgi:hypothetical protein